MKPDSKLNAILAISLCLIAFFIIKVTTNSKTSEEWSEIGKNVSNSVTSTAAYTIEVSGSPGQKFQGSYMILHSNGSSSSKSVQGTVPETYTVEGSLSSCAFQKESEGGALKVTLRRNGEIVKEEETTADFGMVTVAQ